MSDHVVRNAPDLSRFEILVDGTLAGFVDYDLDDASYALLHTEVFPTYGGRGVGTSLIVETLKQIRELGGTALPYCMFIPRVIREHPDLVDLVPEQSRARFGL